MLTGRLPALQDRLVEEDLRPEPGVAASRRHCFRDVGGLAPGDSSLPMWWLDGTFLEVRPRSAWELLQSANLIPAEGRDTEEFSDQDEASPGDTGRYHHCGRVDQFPTERR